ncbi:MAG: nicotinate-nucleotide adenylyltransferase [Gammaproteobacteria bacterium]|nr:nicotinate-nucleotide adenylyltransferase [Gammaproteobacteria bacterium]
MKRSAAIDGLIGLFGGTFDPVHVGHLRTAFELCERLGFDELRFIPAAVPPHRATPSAPIELRVRMIEAAIAGQAGLTLDLRELERAGPSYTVDTAASLRAEFPRHALCLLLGMDAFAELPSWHEWQRLLDLVNIVVAQRPGSSLPTDGAVGRLLAERRVDSGSDWQPSGQIVVLNVTQLEVSSTDLRASIRAGIEPRYLVPDAVAKIITEAGCYAEPNEIVEP